MNDTTVFDSEKEYTRVVKSLKSQNRLHGLVERRLSELLARLYPEAHVTSEVSGVLGGRNDLMQFFFNGRRVVFELFFSPSQVPQDLRLLEQCNADVRIAVLLDYDINSKLADEYFRKKPDHFNYLWLRQVMVGKHERFCLARLKELIDEEHVVVELRKLLSTPASSYVEGVVKKQLGLLEAELSLSTSSEQVDLRSLNGQQLAVLTVVSRIRRLGVPQERLVPLLAWLNGSIEFAFTLVAIGFQAFLITDLKEHYAIWSDGDLADDLILGAEDRAEGKIVMCLNQIINDVLRAYGKERSPVMWHFFHTYEEHIGHIEPAWRIQESEGQPNQ